MSGSAVAVVIAALAIASPVDEAEAAFAEERFAEAAELFDAAYQADPQPRYLFAQAQSERFAGNCARAIELFDAFLATSPTARAEQDARVAQRECEAKTEPPPPPPPPDPAPADLDEEELADDDPPPPARTRPWHRDPLGGVLVGGGLAVTTVGLALLGGAIRIDRGAPSAYEEALYESEQQRAVTLHRAGFGLIGAGAALVLGGVIRWVVVARRRKGRQ
jgi:tetratricopeptide (TPR) repeat protein